MTAAAEKTARPSEQQVNAAYDACAAMTREAATNFYYAFLTLPKAKRRAIYATYAFCRLCDDIVDNPSPNGDAQEQLAAVREKLSAAYNGGASGHIWTALADSQRRFSIREQHYAAVIEGCEMDLTRTRYETFGDLVEYCKRVASAVGLVCIEVCGYEDPRAVDHAVDLGIAMQLTNVVRDVQEDARNGRIYLPQEDLRQFGYSEEDLLAGVMNENFRELIKFQVERARRYFENGKKLFPLLDRRSRACPQAMAEVYMALLDRVEAADYDVLSQRVSLSRKAKLLVTAKLWMRSRVPRLSR